jgi:hypothetical protein
MGTATHVYFGVFDFGDDPRAVSEIMGLEPTEAWVKGEHYSASSPGARRTHSRWALESGLDEGEPLEGHIRALLARLEPKQVEIRQVAERFTARIGVAQYFYEMNPGFRIESDILERLANLGLPIDFDQYCLGQDEGS